MKKRSILYSPKIEELKKKKRKVLKVKMIFFFISFLLLFIGLIFLSRWKKININNVEISGNKIIETQDIQSIVDKDLSGNYLFFFPKTNFILYPKRQIKKDLENKFKRFSFVSVDIEKVKNLEINVQEREGKYIWCGENIEAVNSNPCYFMDQSGYIFDESPYFSGNVYFRFYGKDNLDLENPSGSYFLQNYFMKIIQFKEALELMDLKPNAFFVDENGDANIVISSDLISGPRVVFKLDSDYEKIAENLQAAITTLPLQSKIKNNFSLLLYIDLRFGDNIYYKFKQDKLN